MNNIIKQIALSLLAMSPLTVSAMDIGLTVGVKGSFDVYGGKDLDFADYKKLATPATVFANGGTPSTDTGQVNTLGIQGSKIKLDYNFGASGGLSAGAVIMNMFTIEIEGGYAGSFMQDAKSNADVQMKDAAGNNIGTDIVAKEKDIAAFALPYGMINLYFSTEIPDTGIVPYIGAGFGMAWANINFDDMEANVTVHEVVKTAAGGAGFTSTATGSAAVSATAPKTPEGVDPHTSHQLKDLMKAEGDFKYVRSNVFHIGFGIGYKISDSMTISGGYRLLAGTSDIEFKNEKLEDNIIKTKLLKNTVLGTLRYVMPLSES